MTSKPISDDSNTHKNQPPSTKETIPLSLTLESGRNLAYAIYGPPNAINTVFHCNGSGGSRLEHPPLGKYLETLNSLSLRFVSIDRPGHGASDYQDSRTLEDFSRDVAALADHLEAERFYIEGWSAGGAYALAVARFYPTRVIRCAILSGIAPPERPAPYAGIIGQVKVWMFMSRNFSPLVYPFRRMMASVFESKSADELGLMICQGDAADEVEIRGIKEAQLMMGNNFKEGYRQGHVGPALDDLIINRPWGFRLEDIKVDVDLWWGEVDQNVPLCQGKYIESKLTNCQLKVMDGCAHLFPLTKWREILESLLRNE